ncbi:MAG TPA: diphosphate--fructose-6-phosphate 1-phosphotransferase [Ignavibacteria bacterium]|nr:6-phosphofructokinase [Bacteroidota bacterium]HRI84804.1 diphosphate--fructose-6-phosphate 1-phosphotransferase [Ignavibacteria bacterium]HRJ99245.1 diphosphate--fructose-6-phosphate 1-phosphotransferase [Ignavibacteria bacterium]
MDDHYRKKTLAILVGGGPAPGINGVIRSVTIEAINSGLTVYGIFEGFEHLSRGDSTHFRELKIEDVSRIHYTGGSILYTSRVNPAKSKEMLDATLKSLTQLSVDYLITIGGDDTATSAYKIDQLAKGQIQVAHVPKTIDNDLPLPGNMPTFGYQTARDFGFRIVQSLMLDAATTRRWYYVVSMGRKAGHLALGIGKAAGATLTIIGEEFRNTTISFETVCDILEASIIKRMSQGNPYGVAILAEGIITRIDQNELMNHPYVNLEKDLHGNIRLSEVDIGRITKDEVRRRLRERGINVTIVNKDIGYELRCADPIPYDCEYTQDLGYAAVRYLLDDNSGAIVTVDKGSLIPIKFEDIINSEGRISTREADVDSDSYQVARKYMIRLEKSDFDELKNVARLALIGNMKTEEFIEKFKYLTNDPPVKNKPAG